MIEEAYRKSDTVIAVQFDPNYDTVLDPLNYYVKSQQGIIQEIDLEDIVTIKNERIKDQAYIVTLNHDGFGFSSNIAKLDDETTLDNEFTQNAWIVYLDEHIEKPIELIRNIDDYYNGRVHDLVKFIKTEHGWQISNVIKHRLNDFSDKVYVLDTARKSGLIDDLDGWQFAKVLTKEIILDFEIE